eukprot:PhM_4_TR8286/c2_g4_i4/m.92643
MPQILLIAVISPIFFVHCATAAAITYTLAMDHAEHFCGILGSLPITNFDVPCSVSSPRWDGISGIGVNPLNTLAYAADMDAMTITSVPIPDLTWHECSRANKRRHRFQQQSTYRCCHVPDS